MNIPNIYFAPFNDISDRNKKKLKEKENYNFLGFVDKEKIGKEIITPTILKDKIFDKVIISSSGYFRQIYNEYLTLGIPKSKIFFYSQATDEIINNIYLYYFYVYIFRKK